MESLLTTLPEPFIPHGDQENAIDFALKHKFSLVKAGVGAGKTLVAVEAVLRSEAQRVLVIAPLNTAKSWRSTFHRQSAGQVDVRWINARAAGQKALADVMAGIPGVYFIGREYFRGKKTWRKVKLDFVVYDEVHAISNWKTASFKVAKTLNATYKLALSATPAGDHMKGMWAISTWLWPKLTPRGFWNWITEFFHTEHDPFADSEYGEGKKVTVERNPGAVWDSLPAAYTMESVYKEEPTIHEVEVDISPVQRRHYRELEEESLTWLKENPLAIDLPSVLHTRLRQVCLAVPSVEQGWVRRKDKETGEMYDALGDIVWFDDDAKSSKIDALVEILTDLHAESPVPVLVFTDSRKFATVVTKRLLTKKFRARQFVGGMSDEERLWKLEQFGKKFDIMVCVISAIGEGTDGLQYVCNTEVWLNFGYYDIQNQQAFGRLSRQGQTKTVQRFIIKARNTVEDEQSLVLLDKREQLALGYREKEAV